MTLVLLDTHRLPAVGQAGQAHAGSQVWAKRVRTYHPQNYRGRRSEKPRLRHHYPWFDNPELAKERLAKQVRLSGVAVAVAQAAIG